MDADAEHIQIIRSKRKTMAIQIRDGALIVRAPLRTGTIQIQQFLEKNRSWIDRHLEKARAAQRNAVQEGLLSEGDMKRLAEEALQVIPQRVAYYADRMGVTYGRITIRNQRTRWGSCSAKGNLNFNCLLMLAPPEVLDAVVVHELAHRKEMNHSDRFYAVIREVYPDYPKWNRWLKENGSVLLGRMRGM